MDHATDFLLLGLSILLVALLVQYTVSTTKQGQKLPNQLADNINSITSDLNEVQYTKYCNDDMTGSDVVTAVRKFKTDGVIVQVTIYTSTTQTRTMDTLNELGGSFQNLPTSDKYINPAATFTGSLKRNSNGVIEKLIFKQNSYISVADINSGTSTQTTVAGSHETAQIDENSEVDSPSNSESQKDTDNPVNLDIVFSDESTKSGNTAEVQYLKSIQNAADNYASKLDDVNSTISAIDVNEDDCADTLSNAKTSLNGLLSDISTLEKEIQSSKTLSSEQIQVVVKSLNDTKNGVKKAQDGIVALKKELQAHLETTSKWYIGYPVASKVSAELKNGVLTISGSGRVDIGHNLPKWISRAKEIRQVRFSNTVAPVNIDYWFSGCRNLESVNFIPKSVESANGTFQNCDKLTQKLIIDSTRISSTSAFRTCDEAPKPLTVCVKSGSKSEKTFKEYLQRVQHSKCSMEIEVIK